MVLHYNTLQLQYCFLSAIFSKCRIGDIKGEITSVEMARTSSTTICTTENTSGIAARNPFSIHGSIVTMKLTQGLETVFDLPDLAVVSPHRWCAHRNHRNVYPATNVKLPNGKRRMVYLHKMFFPGSDVIVDHVNLDGLDNRRENLRVCTQSENLRNRRLNRRSKTGLKGVSWHCGSRKYEANIRVNGRQTRLGYFSDPIAAARAYDDAARKYHGEFARVNFPALRAALKEVRVRPAEDDGASGI
jgi:hypothetical protein